MDILDNDVEYGAAKLEEKTTTSEEVHGCSEGRHAEGWPLGTG